MTHGTTAKTMSNGGKRVTAESIKDWASLIQAK
jgi:hypothetical protein